MHGKEAGYGQFMRSFGGTKNEREKSMKRVYLLIVIAAILLGCASDAKPPAVSGQVSGLVSLDEALAGAVTEVGSKVQGKTEIVIASLDTSLVGVSEFLSDELASLLVSSGNFIILERGPALDALTAEHGIQMSGLVSDESAVGIGHYLGAKVVLTGTFTNFASFNQIRVRAIDVRTSEILTLYTVRILPNDAVLADVLRKYDQNIPAQAVTEDALAHLNRGIDLFNAGKFAEAIDEFNKALAINKNLAEAYYHRANTRWEYSDYISNLDIDDDEYYGMLQDAGIDRNYTIYADSLMADYNAAIALKPDYADALFNRAFLSYSRDGADLVKVLEDLTAAININRNHIKGLLLRGDIYCERGIYDYDRAIADYTAVIRMEPNNYNALNRRGGAHWLKKDYARAIADFEASIRYDPNNYGAAARNLTIMRQEMQQ